jgi:hypothetical protein
VTRDCRSEIYRPGYPGQIVYRGRDAIGAISQLGRQWLAFDIDGRKIGSFGSRLAAFAAVLREARQ